MDGHKLLKMATKSALLLSLLSAPRWTACLVPTARSRFSSSALPRILQPKLSQLSTSMLQLSSNPFLHSPLAMTITTSTTSILVRAALTLICSAAAGIIYDKKRGDGLGTLVTLLIAAHGSNLNLSPSHNILYNFCWTRLLPSCLALILLASPSAKDRCYSRQDIRAVAIPFLIASVGSILGCTISFVLTLLGAIHSTGWRLWRPGRLLLPPIEAVVQAGCLCASFIGGPVNYFGVRHILVSSDELLGHDGGVLESLLGSSISDLFLFALYFSVSTTALNSKRLQLWFPERIIEEVSDETFTKDSETPFSKRRTAIAVVIAAFLANEMVKVSAALGRTYLSIPGLMSMSLAGLGAICSTLLPRILSLFHANALMDDIRSVSFCLSDICFYLLFAAIGASANLKEAVKLGGWHFASGALFASMALAVHIVTLFGGSLAVQKLLNVRLGLEEILVASIAAIGGPLSAVDFANRTTKRRRGLIIAATVWGVVGYVIATEVGITLIRLLLPLLPCEWR